MRQRSAEDERALRVAGDLQRAVAPPRQRRRRPDRAVHQERARERRRVGRVRLEGGLERPGRGVGLGHAVEHAEALGGLLQQPARQRGLVGQLGLLAPARARAQRVARPQGLVLALGHHGEEVAVADDGHDARDRLGPRHVHVLQPRALARAPHHARVQHARLVQVADEPRGPGDEPGDVEPRAGAADDAVVARRLGRGGAGRLTVQVPAGDELPVRDPAAVGRDHRAVLDHEVLGGCAEPVGGQGEQRRARLGRGLAQRGPAVGHRHAPGRQPLVQRVGGVARAHAHALEGDVELLGADARDGRDQALAELDLARVEGHGLALGQAHPRVEPRVRGEVGGQAHAATSSAARRAAASTRGWVPQRHRCGARASRMRSSLGAGSWSSSAATRTTMAGMQ